ncbi:MAG: hypothetical protein LBQ87_04260 [Candidatus Fibromonas sp.]|jgi:peptidoglycan hydrolase CwlO-like protein|nr:hypothetical protein [Candidatus Fibromonas sp.]
MTANNGYGTKMDDIIIESLKPQVEEIKQKLAGGGGLSQGDIITLTLYAQGNHINHLDMRMDAIEESFKKLQVDFADLRADFEELRADFAKLQADFEKFRADIYEKISELHGKISDLHGKISEFQGNFTKMTAIISSVCAATIAIVGVITKILS